jgi:undecaprenyl-diphosphatase
VLLLGGIVVGALLALVIVWSSLRRYAPRLKTRYAQAAARFGESRWIALVDRLLPRLRRSTWLRTELVALPLVMFGLLLVSLHGFAELAENIGPKEALNVFDRALSAALPANGESPAGAFFASVTHLGGGIVLTVLTIVVALTLVLRRLWVPLYAWLLAVAGSALLNVILKAWYARARPGTAPLLDTWSFPSGHAMNSLVAYGMLAYLLVHVLPLRWMPAVIGSAVTIVLLVGASRIFLHYHYFSDVLGGYSAGFAWLAVCITVCELGLRRARARATPRSAA